jgi:multiple RNA-binding domain-containing protein 1
MQPRSKTNVWANEEAQIDHGSAPAVQAPADLVIEAGESDDEYQVIAKKTKTTEHKPSIEAEPVVDIPMEEPKEDAEHNGEDAAEVKKDAPSGEQGPVSDADWLRSRTNRVLDFVADDDDDPPPPSAPATAPKKIQEMSDAPEADTQLETANEVAEEKEKATVYAEDEKIRETGRLYLRNLSYDITEEDLREHFSKHGSLEEVRQCRIFLSHRCNDEHTDRDN